MDDASRQVLLSGGVTLTTSSGYRLETAEVAAKLDRTGLESRTAVVASGPAGEIRADGMVLGQDNRTPGAYVLVFKGGVRLVYQPGG
jgi:lipopolysaccharide export system protein LptC